MDEPVGDVGDVEAFIAATRAAMGDGPNWEGVPGGTEHRTVGAHRARCWQCNEWCYPDSLCPCCDRIGLPKRWAGLNVGDVLAELRGMVEALPTSRGDMDGLEYVPVDAVLALFDGDPDD